MSNVRDTSRFEVKNLLAHRPAAHQNCRCVAQCSMMIASGGGYELAHVHGQSSVLVDVKGHFAGMAEVRRLKGLLAWC